MRRSASRRQQFGNILATDIRTLVRYTSNMPRLIYDWKAIQQYHDEGHGFVECQKRFGFSHTAWVKAVKRGQLEAGEREFGDRRRRYDWSEVQAYYDEGHSYRECRLRFGFCAASWTKAVRRGELTARARAWPLPKILSESKSRRTVKQALLRAGILLNKCEECGLDEWRGKPLSVHVDHINGIRDDHRLENLRMLCPNCHSQTETYGSKNRRRLKHLQDPRVPV